MLLHAEAVSTAALIFSSSCSIFSNQSKAVHVIGAWIVGKVIPNMVSEVPPDQPACISCHILNRANLQFRSDVQELKQIYADAERQDRIVIARKVCAALRPRPSVKARQAIAGHSHDPTLITLLRVIGCAGSAQKGRPLYEA